ncbi:ABC transporter permease [Pseudonocardia pini]|uniref:ABC transporter permease n=1 Tax=Pseudonocardia pini TaxID=2758030 RepID=UPI0015F00C26|nr:ABC transporter permease [Pseudonocardia pini]
MRLARHRWWLARLAMLPVHLAVFAVAVFFLVRLMPGDPVLTIAGPNAEIDQATYDRIAADYGFDGSVGEQLVGYLGGLVGGDLGDSLVSQTSVAAELSTRLPATLELVALGMVVACLTALVASYIVVTRPRTMVARVLRVWARAAGAVPEFVIGVALITVTFVWLRIAPAPVGLTDRRTRVGDPVTGAPLLDSVLTGRFDVTASILAHLWVPLVVMALAFGDLLTKHLVSQLETSIDSPVTRFRAAVGVPRRRILLSVYRRALPAPVTVLGVMFGALLGGVVLLETLFNFQGLGQYALAASNAVDLTALQGFLLLTAAVSLVVFLVTDIAVMLLDPRRRPGAGGTR